MARKPTTKDLFDKIESQKGKIPVVGVVSIDGENDQIIKFSQNNVVDSWISIPILMVDDIDFIHNITIKNQEYPLVSLTLKEPSNDEAKVFAYLLKDISNLSAAQIGMTGSVSRSYNRMDASMLGVRPQDAAPVPGTFVGPAMASLTSRSANNFGTVCGWVIDAVTGQPVYRCL